MVGITNQTRKKQKIMKNIISTATIATAICATGFSCSLGGNDEQTRPQTEIKLSTAVEAPSRTAFDDADTRIPAEQNVFVWVAAHGADKETAMLYDKILFTSDGNGGLTSKKTTMYFPQTDDNVDIYALHNRGTIPIWSDAQNTDARVKHSVMTDQQTLRNYVWSDMIYAKRSDVARTESAVQLTFRHLLSKLRVAVKLGQGLNASDVKGLRIGNVQFMTEFPLSDFVLSAKAAPSLLPVADTADITISADISTDFDTPLYNDAIIVPQTVATGSRFLIVTFRDGVELAYALPKDATFESGKKYIYHITVTHTEITVGTTIENWDDGGVVEGEAAHLVK